jgi:predicted kinase
MAKPKLLVLKGLPASGKSTYAKRLVAEQGYARTNKDTIRKEMFGEDYKRKDEKKVVKERDRQVREALTQGNNVVVDDTNLNPVHIKELFAIAKEFNTIFEVDDSFLDVPLTECIERDRNREDSVGENVIRGMYHEFVKKKFDGKEYDPSLPFCVISDIDGTLAHMNGKRKPYDWHKVGLDDIDLGVAHILDGVSNIGYATIFMFSGRDEVCRPETMEWLERHDIEYEALYMRRSDHLRPDGGQVADTEVKAEMYEKYIKGKYNVLFVLDDRPQVCRQWRDKYGLRVLNLGDPYFEF